MTFIGRLFRWKPLVGIIFVVYSIALFLGSIFATIDALETLINKIIDYKNYRRYLEDTGPELPYFTNEWILLIPAIAVSVFVLYRIIKCVSKERMISFLALLTAAFSILLSKLGKMIPNKIMSLDETDVIYTEMVSYFSSMKFIALLIVISLFFSGLICGKVAKKKSSKGINIASFIIIIVSGIMYIIIAGKTGQVIEAIKAFAMFIASLVFLIYIGKEMAAGVAGDIYSGAMAMANQPSNYYSDMDDRLKKENDRNYQIACNYADAKRAESAAYNALNHRRPGEADYYFNEAEKKRNEL